MLTRAVILLLLLIAGPPPTAIAHEIGEHAGASTNPLVSGWTADPFTLIPILIAAAWYLAGIRRAAREGKTDAVPASRIAAFGGGMLVLTTALQSPIDTVSEDLFSVHMIQHLLLMLAGPPLLVWSDCPIVFLRALPRLARKAAGRAWAGSRIRRIYEALMHPLAVWAAFCGAFVFWHAPGPYQWALDHRWVHILEHLSFFLTSLAFWAIVLPGRDHRRRLSHGPTLLFIVSTAVLSGLPGALMIFSPRPLYPGHADGVVRWHLTLLEDQQLAGLIMWIPAGGAYVLAASLIFLAWLRDAEIRAIGASRPAIQRTDAAS